MTQGAILDFSGFSRGPRSDQGRTKVGPRFFDLANLIFQDLAEDEGQDQGQDQGRTKVGPRSDQGRTKVRIMDFLSQTLVPVSLHGRFFWGRF